MRGVLFITLLVMVIVGDVSCRFTTLYPSRVEGKISGVATIKFSYDVAGSLSGLFIQCGYFSPNGFQQCKEKG